MGIHSGIQEVCSLYKNYEKKTKKRSFSWLMKKRRQWVGNLFAIYGKVTQLSPQDL